MLRIQNLTDDALQRTTVVLPDGTSFIITIYYMPLQYSWFIRSIEYGDFILNCMRISNNVNILRQFKNQIPFGLSCFTEGNREPTQLQDFSSGAAKLFVLTEEEVSAYEEYLRAEEG